MNEMTNKLSNTVFYAKFGFEHDMYMCSSMVELIRGEKVCVSPNCRRCKWSKSTINYRVARSAL